MKHVFSLMLAALLVGDCVQLVKGVFKGEYWIVTKVHRDGTFDLKQGKYFLRDVRGSYLRKADACK